MMAGTDMRERSPSLAEQPGFRVGRSHCDLVAAATGAARRRGCWASGVLLVVIAMAHGGDAAAEVLPQSFGGDSRIREVRYDADQVLKLEGVVGYHLHLELEEGESFVNLGAGDTAAVEVGAEGRHLMLKPKQETVATNLTLLTNKRVYTIEYTARRGRELRPSVYVVRFRYPAVAVPEAPEPEPPAVPRNRDYWACGAAELRPVEAFDDGVQTHLRFAAQAEWPAIFVAGSDGSEGLVNFHVEGDVAIIHRIARRLVLRRGERVACVENRSFDGGGRSLPSGTIAAEVERTTKGGQP